MVINTTLVYFMMIIIAPWLILYGFICDVVINPYLKWKREKNIHYLKDRVVKLYLDSEKIYENDE